MHANHKNHAFHNKLLALRNRIDVTADQVREEALHGEASESTAGELSAPLHLGDLASQESETIVTGALAENEAHLRTEIEDALTRIQEGTFGDCEKCGVAINRERLHAVPYSRFCIECARRLPAIAEIPMHGWKEGKP